MTTSAKTNYRFYTLSTGEKRYWYKIEGVASINWTKNHNLAQVEAMDELEAKDTAYKLKKESGYNVRFEVVKGGVLNG